MVIYIGGLFKMSKLSLEIKNCKGETLAESSNDDIVSLAYFCEYLEGDYIVLKCLDKNKHMVIQLDDAINPAYVYLAGNEFVFPIPFGEKKTAYSPKSFSGKAHLISARLAEKFEISAYKNLAKNEYDHHENFYCYPHASANVETRGEAVFAARNAIDGNTENHGHGAWPYESWGINRRDDAEIKISFGRPVDVDLMVIYIRADFPHDNWWEKVDFVFSDGSEITCNLVKTSAPQKIAFEKKTVEWIIMKNMVKSNDPSPFPALTQWEIYGKEADFC
jgi:hypothetical protein